ncbi:MAG: hydrogenase formation protein HypD [Deltaproteobacteria bacterium]|nr:hydrogenase formation protein HypD [Deltaproteobacteria bacterium]
MRFQEEFRDATRAEALVEAIKRRVTRPWTIMEVCGGQTHAIMRFGLQDVLPKNVELVHGPGCPVCVTPVELIDKAIAIARRPEVVFTSFGDMLRVPGSNESLLQAKAQGADVRMVYSPLDAVTLAERQRDRQVVFFAVGFETTAPATAMAAYRAKRLGLTNFSLLVSHVLVPPAISAILASPKARINGFLAAGHVCTIMGTEEYLPIAQAHHVPIVVTGFEPVDILHGLYLCLTQLEEGRGEVENAYARVVRDSGNVEARRIMREVFEVGPRVWRGIGAIPASGLVLSEAYRAFDGETRFDVRAIGGAESPECISGLVLQGLAKPWECKAFGVRCTPEHPLGAPMVSSEGVCAAYHRFGRASSWQSTSTSI